jgi:hypothetical protein
MSTILSTPTIISGASSEPLVVWISRRRKLERLEFEGLVVEDADKGRHRHKPVVYIQRNRRSGGGHGSGKSMYRA